MYKISFVHRITKILVDIMFFGGILVCVALPFVMPTIMESYAYASGGTAPSTIILVASGWCSVYILYQFKLMFKTLIGKEPFVHQNVSCFRKCGVASFLISIIYFVRLVIGFTIASAIITVIFAMLGLFSLTMKDVFKQAVFYKEENDWTV
ncbi:MAG: DUF2975 domain-containing protein [Defluviitaleaceae bacterium]|nr:DUF2975 domain-containing protein [Defluviitaleaceae bacterium]